MLSDERIETLRKRTFSTDNPFCPVDRKSMWKAAKAVEAEVRKDDESLIRQMLEHLEVVTDAGPDGEGWQSQDLKNTIAAARARLEKAP